MKLKIPYRYEEMETALLGVLVALFFLCGCIFFLIQNTEKVRKQQEAQNKIVMQAIERNEKDQKEILNGLNTPASSIPK